MNIKHCMVLFLIGACLLAFSACGKKGPPKYVEKRLVIQVERLSATINNGRVHLQGFVTNSHSLTKQDYAKIRCQVFLAQYPLENPPCEGCPLKYKFFKEIKGPVISKEDFSCNIPLGEKTGIYYFRVSLSGPDEETGPTSEPAKLIMD